MKKLSNRLTDDQVEQEITRLASSPEVKLAKKQDSIRLARRQYLYTLRGLYKRGEKLMEDGYTLDNIAYLMESEDA